MCKGKDFFLCLISCLFFIGCEQPNDALELRLEIAEEVREALNNKLDVWYPRVIDREYGGYLTNFTYDWSMEENQDKFIVTQTRHLWTLSKVGSNFPDRDYLEYADLGFQFLRDHMWDEQYGGFFQNVTREGEPIPNEEGEFNKTLYGNVFAIYGLASYYEYSQNPDALELAQESFDWLNDNARDPVYEGYFQNLDRSGTPIGQNPLKDYNSGIHTLEAFYELYSVWPDEHIRDRLEEMFFIIRDVVTTDQGYLNLYFEADWTHVSYRDSSKETIMENLSRDHVTPGHDIETAYLLYEAAHALGWQDDETTLQIIKRMVDHTLDHGWDSEAGGIYDVGYYFQGGDQMTVVRDTKTWWAQAETLNPLLMMADYYPEDPRNYFNKFVMQWEYIKEYLIDHEHGGWFTSGLDKNPDARTARKSQAWKGNYHTVRSMMEVIHRLE